jgi:hypothetical protein
MKRRCQDLAGCTAHDHGSCRHCGVRFSKHWPAWSFDGVIWLCEACYCTVCDTVDAAVEEATGGQHATERPS